LYGIKGGARVITADNSFEFDPFAPVEVDGFELELAAGLGAIVTYVPLEVIASGSVSSTDSLGDLLAGLVEDQYYSYEGTGGPWHWAYFAPWDAWDNYLIGLEGNGNVGYDGNASGGTPTGMRLDAGFPTIAAEAISAIYGRGYFKQEAANIYIRVSDASYGDNAGSMGYVIRNARVDGRRITLGAATIQNICPV
jgi:hypothetical protein